MPLLYASDLTFLRNYGIIHLVKEIICKQNSNEEELTIMRNMIFNKIKKTVITLVMTLTIATIFGAYTSAYQPVRDGSKDDYWTSGSLDGASDSLIADMASTGGFSAGVLMDILNHGYCLGYIDTWKAMGEIPQDFYPTGTSASNTQSTPPASTTTPTIISVIYLLL